MSTWYEVSYGEVIPFEVTRETAQTLFYKDRWGTDTRMKLNPHNHFRTEVEALTAVCNRLISSIKHHEEQAERQRSQLANHKERLELRLAQMERVK